jgi:hypothetical protein
MSKELRLIKVACATVSALFLNTSQALGNDPVFVYGASDADNVAVLSGVPGYKNVFWWDHPNLTVAVRAAGNVDPAHVTAMHSAIQVWSATLAILLPEISLTDVTDSKEPGGPDIILRYVPHAGGVQWSGVANCGVQKCNNVIVRSEEPPGSPYAEFDALHTLRTSMHELGHALGLGHAAPLDTSHDLMGYGWSLADPNLVPILSDCDLEGIRAAFGWLFAGELPHPSSAAEVTCGQ